LSEETSTDWHLILGRHLLVLPKVSDGGLEYGGLVHLPIVGAHHVAQLGHQIVELKQGEKKTR
jgi:hypothetical protein